MINPKSLLQSIQNLIQNKQYVEALAALDEYLAQFPQDPFALFLFGQIMLMSEKPAVALSIFTQLLRENPNRWELWCNTGKCWDDLQHPEHATEFYMEAMGRGGTNSTVALNLSTNAINRADADAAIKWANKAIEYEGDAEYRGARVNLGFAKLAKRDWSGWHDYAYGVGHIKFRDLRVYGGAKHPWDGQYVDRLVVYGEQGLGDQILLAGAVNEAKKHCGELILDVHPKLAELFSRSFGVEAHGSMFKQDLDWATAPVDASIALSELQCLFRARDDQVDGSPYLIADSVRAHQWAEILNTVANGRPKIGIAWTGGTTNNQARRREITLDQFRPLLEDDRVCWVNLEYRDREQDIKASGLDIHSWPWALVCSKSDERMQGYSFEQTAALVSQLDLVIAVPTTVVHLAGALGVPAWCLLNANPNFVWGNSGENMPFYDCVKLLRREEDDPAAQIQQTRSDLDEFLRRYHSDRPRTRDAA